MIRHDDLLIVGVIFDIDVILDVAEDDLDEAVRVGDLALVQGAEHFPHQRFCVGVVVLLLVPRERKKLVGGGRVVGGESKGNRFTMVYSRIWFLMRRSLRVEAWFSLRYLW